MANELVGKSQEDMVEIAKNFNSGVADPNIDESEAEARKASAEVPTTDGSKTAEELAEEASSFVKGKVEEPSAEEVFKSDDAGNPEANKVEEVEPDTSGDAFPESDDLHLNAALKTMKAAGMTGDDVNKLFADAINSGDVSKVDRDALVKAVGEDNATLVMAGVTKWSDDAGAAALAAAREVQESVGGAENWAKMRTWAKTKAANDPDFKKEIEEITDMLNGTATSRKLGAKAFKDLYNGDPSNSSIGNKKVVEATSTKAPPVKKLTAKEAYQAKEKLSRQRQLGKITLSEYNAGMRKISSQRQR